MVTGQVTPVTSVSHTWSRKPPYIPEKIFFTLNVSQFISQVKRYLFDFPLVMATPSVGNGSDGCDLLGRLPADMEFPPSGDRDGHMDPFDMTYVTLLRTGVLTPLDVMTVTPTRTIEETK